MSVLNLGFLFGAVDKGLTKAMKDASKKLDFEAAAKLRDEIGELRKQRHAPKR